MSGQERKRYASTIRSWKIPLLTCSP